MKTLIVEDSPSIATRLEETLRAIAGVEVAANVPTEDEALAACDRAKIDFAVIDLQLAQGTGFGVIRRLRQLAAPTCIVVLTGHAVPALRTAAYEAGADHFLDKSRGFKTVTEIARTMLDVLARREIA